MGATPSLTRLTKGTPMTTGQPRHPLYVRADTQPMPFGAGAEGAGA